jgi:chromosome segregation ATPase
MSASRSFNHYTEWRGVGGGGGGGASSSNKSKLRTNNPSHELNQHSLQQRGKVGGIVKQVNVEKGTGRYVSNNNNNSSNAMLAWPDDSSISNNKSNNIDEEMSKGGGSVEERSTISAHQTALTPQRSMHNGNSHEDNNEQNSNKNDDGTPIVTAKNARNFWKSKEEQPIKVWKPPSNSTPLSPSRNSVGSTNGGVTSRGGGSSSINTYSSMNDNNHNRNNISSQQNMESWVLEEESNSSHSNTRRRRRREPNKLLLNNDNSVDTTISSSRHHENNVGDHAQKGHSNFHLPQHKVVQHMNMGDVSNKNHYHQQRSNHHSHKKKFDDRTNINRNGSSTATSISVNDTTTSTTDDGAIGEMQIKLDIAAAQLLTEEMKYKDLTERFTIYKNDKEDQVLSMRKELEKIKKEERAKENKQGSYIQALEEELNKAKHGNEDSNHQKEIYKAQLDEREKLKILVQKQQVELNELCSEVQRLHSNHKDDSGIMNNRIKSLEREKNDLSRQEKSYQNEIVSLKAQLEEQAEMIQQRQGMHSNSSRVQEELHDIRKDFKKLSEEIERLEKELEAVTEDRDELLRRSVLYHNAAVDSGNHSPKQLNGDKDVELIRVRGELEQSETLRKKQESRIHELENLLNGHRELESLDLSAIDFENTSFLTSDKQGKTVSLDELNNLQKECNKYKSEVQATNERIEDNELEKNELKECLAEAMQEIEKLMDDKTQSAKRNEAFVEDLMLIIKDRDQEIEQLRESVKNESEQDVNVSDSLREELLNMVEWLNSSNSVNGSPSIECMLTDPNSLSEKGDAMKVPFDKLHNDDPALQSVFDHVTTLKNKLHEAELEIYNLKKQRQVCPSDNKSSLFMRAKKMSKKMNEELQMVDDEGDSYSHLRTCLREAADLIDTLSENISSSEKLKLQSNLETNTCKSGENPPSDEEDLFSKTVQISTFELSKKDDEIVDLKLLVGQLREELNEAKYELSNKSNLEEMPTPTKSNRSSKFKNELETSWRSTAQSSNEEDDMKARMAQSELLRLQNDLKKKCNAEETLKTIIKEKSNRLTTVSSQVESLSKEKGELLKAMEELKTENSGLLESLSQVNLQSSQNNLEKDVLDDTNAIQVECSKVKSDLKAVKNERKMLKKSLAEAVEMLKALQDHVLTAEKERKKMKKQLRAVVSKGTSNNNADSNIPESSNKDFDIISHADQMESQSTILQLRSHIVALDHEICTLNDRIDELDAIKTSNRKEHETSFRHEETIKKLQAKLAETQNAYNVTKSMLEEVSEVNKELLNDLKETEKDEAATLEELDNLKDRLRAAHEEIDAINVVASSTLNKYQNIIHQGASTAEIIQWLYKYSLTLGAK